MIFVLVLTGAYKQYYLKLGKGSLGTFLLGARNLNLMLGNTTEEVLMLGTQI